MRTVSVLFLGHKTDQMLCFFMFLMCSTTAAPTCHILASNVAAPMLLSYHPNKRFAYQKKKTGFTSGRVGTPQHGG